MIKSPSSLALITTLIFFASCSNPGQESRQDPLPKASVKVSAVTTGEIQHSLLLNGKTIYLKKNSIVSPISGYVQKLNVSFGQRVKKNDVLFEIQTKEKKALENMNILDAGAGIIKIIAPANGVINEMNINETGGYIVEGAMLCSIVENKYLMVQVNVPFENNRLIKVGTQCNIFLADKTAFTGTVTQILPVIDEVSQTQRVLIKPNINRQLPENLNLSIHFISTKKKDALLIPRAALMTNETQDRFWVMKLVNDSIAVQIPVVTGIENSDTVEIVSGVLGRQDQIITEGAYGLPDSTVVIVK